MMSAFWACAEHFSQNLMVLIERNLLNDSSQWPPINIFDTNYLGKPELKHITLYSGWLGERIVSWTRTPDNGHLSLFWHKASGNFRTRSFDGDLQIGLNFPIWNCIFVKVVKRCLTVFGWMIERPHLQRHGTS